MYIKSVKIKNFRGMDINVDNFEKETVIIGKNDSGKTNLCYAIRKVLDYKTRRIPFRVQDSTESNKQPITIEVDLRLLRLTPDKRSVIGQYIDQDEEGESLRVTLHGVYDEDIDSYNEYLKFGKIDLSQEFATNRSTPLDKILNIIYIDANYNYKEDSKNFLSHRKSVNEKNDKFLDDDIKRSIEALNETIKKDDIIEDIKNDINSREQFQSVFEDITFDVISNIDIGNMYSSLEIAPLNKDGKSLSNVGDGKLKVLSMLLNRMTYDENKDDILIIEEPENHLYPLLQKHYASLIESLDVNQMIYTTHSPYVVDFKKTKQIIKLVKNHDGFTKHTSKIEKETSEKLGYLFDEELAEMFYYDIVLLVEGLSEKYFYSYLYKHDDKFRDYVKSKNVGIFCVMGVHFTPVKKILEELNIKVLIKTDNDIFKVPRRPEKRYAGYERVLKCLKEDNKKLLEEKLNSDITKELFRFSKEQEGIELINENMTVINEIFEREGIYISNHHNGFEEDFIDFVGTQQISKIGLEKEEVLEYLQEAKLKNLYIFISEKELSIKINDKNKDNILVRFVTNAEY